MYLGFLKTGCSQEQVGLSRDCESVCGRNQSDPTVGHVHVHTSA